MSSNASFKPPRKKHNVLWWVGGVFLLLVVLFLFQLFGPSPRIVVSPQTTYITEPLGANGLPNYEQYLWETSREGVTPENNAGPLLWQALFPGEVDPKLHAVMAAELGLERVPSQQESLIALHSKANREAIVKLLRQHSGLAHDQPLAAIDDADMTQPFWNDANSPTVEQVLDQAMRRPWTSEQIPPLADWVAENQKPLALVVEASRRPRYYLPSPTLLNKDRDMLIAVLLPHVQSIREAGRALSARAMWHLGEGRRNEAWRDIFALHRLSDLMTQGNFLVEQLVAIAMNGMACDATLTLLHQGDLTTDEARQVQHDLESLPDFKVMARSLDQSERLGALDAFVHVGAGGTGALSALTGGGTETGDQIFNVVSVDWNYVLRETNDWYDRLAAAASLPDRQARAAALDKIDADIQALAANTRAPARMLAGVVSRRQRSELVSGIMLSLFLPAVTAATNAEDRANMILQLTRVAAALAVYRAEQGEYPEKLDALDPGAIEQLPVDLYNGKPFVYKRLEDGFLLYSMGENGLDDAGSNAQMQTFEGKSLSELDEAAQEQLAPRIPAGADDISIRAERRKYEWPETAPRIDAP